VKPAPVDETCGAPWPSPPERARRRARRGPLVEDIAVGFLGAAITTLWVVPFGMSLPGFVIGFFVVWPVLVLLIRWERHTDHTGRPPYSGDYPES